MLTIAYYSSWYFYGWILHSYYDFAKAPSEGSHSFNSCKKSFNTFHASLMKAVTPVKKQESVTMRHF
jgi:hypothetical protein